MPKSWFFILVSFLVLLGLYIAYKINDYSAKYNNIRDYTPKDLRIMFTPNVIPKSFFYTNNKTIIVGTSHVNVGFDSCDNSIKQISQRAMSLLTSIDIAKALIYEIKDLHLILEITLITENKSRKDKLTQHPSLLSYNREIIFINFIANLLYRSDDNCIKNQKNIPKAFEPLKESLDRINFDIKNISDLFPQYHKYLNELIEVCQNSVNPKITLVTLPIHPAILKIDEVNYAFIQLDNSIQGYLKRIKKQHSCDIQYLNLSHLGIYYPEQKYWRDRGHFLPEIGQKVLEEIHLSFN